MFKIFNFSHQVLKSSDAKSGLKFQFQGSNNYRDQDASANDVLLKDLKRILEGGDLAQKSIWWASALPLKSGSYSWVFHSWKSEESKAFQTDESKDVTDADLKKAKSSFHMAAFQMRSMTAIQEGLNGHGTSKEPRSSRPWHPRLVCPTDEVALPLV